VHPDRRDQAVGGIGVVHPAALARLRVPYLADETVAFTAGDRDALVRIRDLLHARFGTPLDADLRQTPIKLGFCPVGGVK
jgi:hypothetical protein